MNFKKYEEVQTKSGLNILFLEDKNLPYIEFSLWFLHAGSDYDFTDKSGLSFTTLHLLEQGAGGLSSEVIQENLDYYGADLDMITNRQFSKLSLSGLSWQAKDLWDIFLKIATTAHLDEKEFELIKQQLLDRRYQDLDEPELIAQEVWRKHLFKKESPIGNSLYGTVSSLKQITLEDVKKFYRDYYLKGNPVLTVVGQFDDKLKKQIQSSFEKQFLQDDKQQIPEVQFETNHFFKLVTKKKQVQSQIIIGFPAFPFPKNDPSLFVSLTLANMILGNSGLDDRLMTKLREEMGLTYGVSSHLSLGRNYGLFQISAATQTSRTNVFLKEALRLLKDFQTQGVTEEELKINKLMLKSRILKGMETSEKFLKRIIYYHYYLGASSAFTDQLISTIDDISLKEVNQAIKTHLNPEKLAILILGDPSVKKQLSKIEGLSPLEEIAFEKYFSEELK